MRTTLLLLVIASCTGPVGVERVEPIDALLVLPLSLSVEPGEHAQLSAQRYRNDTATDFTAKATWRSSNTAVATVDATGLVKAVKPGRTVVTGTADGASSSTEIVVTSPAFQLAPAALSLVVTHHEDGGVSVESESLIARTWTGDVATDVTAQTVWGSSNANVAVVTDAGVVFAVAAGHATVSGLFSGLAASVDVSVSEATPEE